MRVLLINPFYPISETPSPPLGLAFLAGSLEQAGIEVQILDCVVFPFSRDLLASVMQAFRPDLVGSTAVTMTVDHALTVLEQVKVLDPAVTTVLGGPHATFCAADILRSFPQVDVVVRGEGETALVKLTHAIASRTSWNRVPELRLSERG